MGVVEPGGRPKYEIRRVLAHGFTLVRERWPLFAGFVLFFDFAPRLFSGLMVHSGYRPGSGDPSGFITYAVDAVALAYAARLSAAAVVATALPKRVKSPLPPIAPILVVFPTLLAIWTIEESGLFFSLMLNLTGAVRAIVESTGSTSVFFLVEVLLLGSLLIPLIAVLLLGTLSPVVLAERPKVGAAFVRTWRLMRGNRWRVLAVYLLVQAPLVAISFGSFGLRALERTGGPHRTVYVTISWTVDAIVLLIGGLWPVLAAASYHELRRVGEGVVLDDVSEIFA
jgi:hypothetical protein